MNTNHTTYFWNTLKNYRYVTSWIGILFHLNWSFSKFPVSINRTLRCSTSGDIVMKIGTKYENNFERKERTKSSGSANKSKPDPERRFHSRAVRFLLNRKSSIKEIPTGCASLIHSFQEDVASYNQVTQIRELNVQQSNSEKTKCHSHCWKLVWLLNKWLERGFGRRGGHNSVSKFGFLGDLWYRHIKLTSPGYT